MNKICAEIIIIEKDKIPVFENKKELSNWVKGIFAKLRTVEIKDTGIKLNLSATNADRETMKRRAMKEENRAVFFEFEKIVSSAIKKGERKADDRHLRDQEIYCNRFYIGNDEFEAEVFVDKPNEIDKKYRYAGHNVMKAIKITPRGT